MDFHLFPEAAHLQTVPGPAAAYLLPPSPLHSSVRRSSGLRFLVTRALQQRQALPTRLFKAARSTSAARRARQAFQEREPSAVLGEHSHPASALRPVL